jgi:hypothetical protein
LFRKVFVYYPRGKQSGGPEALHQLVDSLRRQGVDAFLVAYPHTRTNERVPLYACYDAPEADAVEDTSDSAVVAGEGQYPLLLQVRRAEVFCWWLAIESSLLYQSLRLPYLRSYEAPRNPALGAAKDLVISMRGYARRALYRDSHFTHVTQSEYAWSFLADRKRLPPTMLSDFTARQAHVSAYGRSTSERGGVTYNATKADYITRQVAELCPDVEFIPIRGMAQDQVYETLGRSSIYLDLGAHPGKDRIPREAALAGCVVSVALRGAGAYSADVPIPFDHKVRLDGNMVENAVGTVQAVLKDRAGSFARQSSYRSAISREQTVFDAEVNAIFVAGIRGFDTHQSHAFADHPPGRTQMQTNAESTINRNESPS